MRMITLTMQGSRGVRSDAVHVVASAVVFVGRAPLPHESGAEVGVLGGFEFVVDETPAQVLAMLTRPMADAVPPALEPVATAADLLEAARLLGLTVAAGDYQPERGPEVLALKRRLEALAGALPPE